MAWQGRHAAGLVALAAVALAACASPEAARVPSTESQLCIARHAEAYKNLDPRPDGLTPDQLDTLTPRGEAQARAMGSALPRGVTRLMSSPTLRTRQSAQLLGADAPVSVDPRLRPLDGATPWDERMAAWARGDDPRPADGESLADGAARAEAFLEELRATLPPTEHAVVVTHGDMASLLLGALRGTPLLLRPTQDTLEGGQVICVALGEAP